jgi:hypothetical protein
MYFRVGFGLANVAGNLVHAEDMEGGVRRADARREWVLAALPRWIHRGCNRAEHRPLRGCWMCISGDNCKVLYCLVVDTY